jgi:hypothetical protein
MDDISTVGCHSVLILAEVVSARGSRGRTSCSYAQTPRVEFTGIIGWTLSDGGGGVSFRA